MNYLNDIRLEQFRQLKKEIRGSAEYLIVGLDIAKESTMLSLARRPAKHCTKGCSLTIRTKAFKSF